MGLSIPASRKTRTREREAKKRGLGSPVPYSGAMELGMEYQQ